MSLPQEPYTLRDLVAENLHRLRNVTAAEPEDVARAARQFGLEWTASWYAAVERGQKPLSAEHLLALPPVLTSAFAYRVSLSDLLLGDGSMHLGQPIDGTTLSLHYLRELVTAAPFRRSFLDFDEEAAIPADEAPAALAAAEKMREIVRANLGDVDVRALARAEAGAGDMEAKLAKKLGVTEIVVIAAAASLWGRSMTEEQEVQLNPEEGDPPSAAVVRRRLTTGVKQKLAEAAEAAQAKAAFVAASSAVTAEFPLVQPNRPPKPVEVASGARQWRLLPAQRRVPAAVEPDLEPDFHETSDPEPEPAIAE